MMANKNLQVSSALKKTQDGQKSANPNQLKMTPSSQKSKSSIKQTFATKCKLELPFLSLQNSKLILHQQAEKFLLSIPPQKQIAFVLIYGQPLSGKSFFANRGLLTQKEGFAVNREKAIKTQTMIKLCTKAIDGLNLQLILLEWNGANDDSLLQILLVLISSIIVLASQNMFEVDISEAQHIIKSAYSINSSFKDMDSNCLPAFSWILHSRFSFKQAKMQNFNGILNRQEDRCFESKRKNRLREDFQQLFKVRHAYHLQKRFQHDLGFGDDLDQLQNRQLNKSFLFQLMDIRKDILQNIKAKVVNGVAVNCRLVVTFIKAVLPYFTAWSKTAYTSCKKFWHQSSTKVDATLTNYIQKEVLAKIGTIGIDKTSQNLEKKKLTQWVNQHRSIIVSNRQEFQAFIDRMIAKIKQDTAPEIEQCFDENKLNEKMRTIQEKLNNEFGENDLVFLMKLEQQKIKLLKEGQLQGTINQLRHFQQVSDYFSSVYLSKISWMIQKLKRSEEQDKKQQASPSQESTTNKGDKKGQEVNIARTANKAPARTSADSPDKESKRQKGEVINIKIKRNNGRVVCRLIDRAQQ